DNFDWYGGEEVVWDTLDDMVVGGALARGIKVTTKAANGVRTLNRLKNYEAAQDAAASAVVSPEMRSAMGLDETSAIANALPFDTSIEVIERTGGMANKVNEKLRGYFEEADQLAQDIITGNGFLRENVVSNKYRMQLEDAAQQKFQKEKAENIQVVERDGNSTTFQYQVIDETGELSDQTYTLKFDLDNAGTFEQST